MSITESQINQFREQGYFITGALFNSSVLDELKGEFHRLWEEDIRSAEARGSKNLELVKLRPFLERMHARSQPCARFCRHPAFGAITHALLGSDVDLYYNQAVLKPPKNGLDFAWHQDSRYTITRPLEYVTCWVAVGPATVENGTIWIVPGKHKDGLLPHERNTARNEWQCQFDPSGKIPIEIEAGQMVVFSSLLPHASGPNTSSEIRYAYVPQYHFANAVREETGEPAGDHFPLIRNGRPYSDCAGF